MLRVFILVFGVYCTLVATRYGAKIRKIQEPRMQRKLIWSTSVLGFWALAAILYGFGAFVHGFTYLVATQIMWGVSLMLVATIPCELAYFNRKNIRPLRNLAFLALGGMNLWAAIESLQRGWAS